jgi:hypothetical protein
MDDVKKVALLESTLREILKIDEEAGKGNTPGSMPFYYSLDGDLRYRWIDIRHRARELLKGEAR